MFDIYQNKKVFITGNTGFKGSWLAALFSRLNVSVEGYSLAPVTTPDHYSLLGIDYKTTIGNILDGDKLTRAIAEAEPDIIFHLAAQALVRPSYIDPLNTYETNVTGTLKLLEAARKCPSVRAIVLITTDKVYDNKEREEPYKEMDELGGYDMYSSSKACCEILIKSYRNSFFNLDDYGKKHHVLIASARAGNVIGGGDWSTDRLIPDIAKATSLQKKVLIRNPLSVRPWQHVLDCLHGYLLLGAKLLNNEKSFSQPWNFSPFSTESKNVRIITEIAKNTWPDIEIELGASPDNYHEAGLLMLDNTKAIEELKWKPVWDTYTAVEKTINWYKNYYNTKKINSFADMEEYLKNMNAA